MVKEQIQKSISLAPLTTMRVGGPARFFFEASCSEEIVEALDWACAHETDVFVMGLGSNVVVSDKGYDGLVVRLNGKFSGMEWTGNQARVKAGTVWEDLVTQAVERGMIGIEELVGIPGNVGGAVYMNAGAFTQSTSEKLKSVTSIKSGAAVTRQIHEMEFQYRRSPFTGSSEVIVECVFEFNQDDPEKLWQKRDEILKRRHEKQPLDVCCAGSIFKRPQGHFAGALIEQAGLKGKRIGGARVSEKHAGFIVNEGNATARDIRNLVDHVIEQVDRLHGVKLETEVVFLGAFN